MVPVKNLAKAKSRLRAVTSGHDRDAGSDPQTHAQLVLALALDTVGAAAACPGVRRIVVISPDPRVLAAMRDAGVECLDDVADGGLNRALEDGAAMLRTADSTATVGALQADLPALRADELDQAIDACHDHGRRAYCADRGGTGTTLLLAPPGTELAPRFGVDSATAHRAQGATPLDGTWPGLRCDVDTPADLTDAARLGLGRRTAALISVSCAAR